MLFRYSQWQRHAPSHTLAGISTDVLNRWQGCPFRFQLSADAYRRWQRVNRIGKGRAACQNARQRKHRQNTLCETSHWLLPRAKAGSV